MQLVKSMDEKWYNPLHFSQSSKVSLAKREGKIWVEEGKKGRSKQETRGTLIAVG